MGYRKKEVGTAKYQWCIWIDFVQTLGDRKSRKMCHSGKDIGRACNMSHAEQVAGRKVWLRDLNFSCFLARACNARVCLSVFEQPVDGNWRKRQKR